MAKMCGLNDDQFRIESFVHNPYKYISRSRLFVLSSYWEGLPGSLIEALACGVPVVSTNCPSGPNEILEGGKWGLLTPVGDYCKLAEAILRSVDKPEHMFPRGENRAQEFDLDRSVSLYLQALNLKTTNRIRKS
jgi:glycosyltransferase involved in cell wall biosynthesis